jgi:hypothetical protein
MLYDGSLLLMAVVRYWRWGNARDWWGSLHTVTREVKSYLCKRIRLECVLFLRGMNIEIWRDRPSPPSIPSAAANQAQYKTQPHNRKQRT